jgi:hypothetical protein
MIIADMEIFLNEKSVCPNVNIPTHSPKKTVILRRNVFIFLPFQSLFFKIIISYFIVRI